MYCPMFIPGSHRCWASSQSHWSSWNSSISMNPSGCTSAASFCPPSWSSNSMRRIGSCWGRPISMSSTKSGSNSITSCPYKTKQVRCSCCHCENEIFELPNTSRAQTWLPEWNHMSQNSEVGPPSQECSKHKFPLFCLNNGHIQNLNHQYTVTRNRQFSPSVKKNYGTDKFAM